MHADDRNVAYSPVAGEEPAENGHGLGLGYGLQLQNLQNQSVEKVTIGMGLSTESTNRKFLYIAACTVNIASFVCGVSLAWTSPMNLKLQGKNNYSSPVDPVVSDSEASWIGSLLPLGAAVGPFAAGFFIDKIGRKKTLLASSVPFVIAYVMFAFGNDILYFYLGRFLCGLAVGGTFTVLPLYVAEISDDAVRGTLASFFQLFIVLGLLFSYALGPYLNIFVFNLICVILPIIFILFFMILIPESPYHLVAIKDDMEASRALAKIRSKPEDDVQKELSMIKVSLEEAMRNKKNFFDIFKSKGLTRALMISLSLVSLQQFSGINVILFYTEDIFKATGSSIPSEICTILIGVVQIIGSFITPVLVDRIGKRILFMLSGSGMGISAAVLGYFFYLKDDNHNVDALFWLPVTSLICYIISYCLATGPLPWAVMAELFPADVKSSASTATASFCWFLGFLITKFYSPIKDIIGSANSFYFFAACCFLEVLYVVKFLFETSGKSFQEIQDILNGVKSNQNTEQEQSKL